MKFNLIVVFLIIAIFGACSQASGTRIVVQTEHYNSITPSMQVVTDKRATGKYIEIPLRLPHGVKEGGPADTGHAEYKINVPKAGLYQFWARCRWYDYAGNSFYIIVDDIQVTSKTPFITDETYKKWHWVAGPALQLSAGFHTIRIQNHRDGAKMDQWLLTTAKKNRWQPMRSEKETPQYMVK
jgi:uncharacterized protein YodC (DUF2158 family)